MNLYLDIVGGISGDMMLSSLLGLGVNYDRFIEVMSTLSISDEFEISLSQASKGAIGGNKVDVILKEDSPFVHRNLSDIINIIDNSEISSRAKYMARKIFTVLAEAEAKVHLAKVEDVHFHEVGAVDSIVDIIGTAVLIDMLDIETIYCSEIPLGSGFTWSQHGKIPLPAPATLNLLEDMKVRLTNLQAETVTPTGAAILKGLNAKQVSNLSMKIMKTSIGCGTKNFDIPNILRAILFQPNDYYIREKLAVLSCNLDDMTGELMGNAMEELFDAGALDVWFSPIMMKKSRPAYKLEVLTTMHQKEAISKVIFEQTTTIGIREQIIDRKSLKRKIRSQKTELGSIRIKEAYLGYKKINQKPEFEDLKALAKKKGVTVRSLNIK
ncbi:nickel pincer cofactor biosynthesis protein LarC [Acetoanaerobium noterae]|uniref:nickel pincer cofactor biosynthesis protein LarC n=1 Tax=Acetoanaerobium noterae TaxID=745369 RepID=UPI00322202E1